MPNSMPGLSGVRPLSKAEAEKVLDWLEAHGYRADEVVPAEDGFRIIGVRRADETAAQHAEPGAGPTARLSGLWARFAPRPAERAGSPPT